MSGIVNARISMELSGDAYTIEPDLCPAQHDAFVLCYKHDDLYGARACPWLEWVGKSDTRRHKPDEIAEAVQLLHMPTRGCMVMCSLARRNRGPGLWPTLGAPKMKEE
jgi:hypothetical protein